MLQPYTQYGHRIEIEDLVEEVISMHGLAIKDHGARGTAEGRVQHFEFRILSAV
jgi:hypothetical protein